MSEHLVNTNEKTPFPKSAEADIMTKTAVEVALKEGDKIALVGNPNVGKSVIFGVLTGRYVTVSNYPGTTVEVSRGKARIENCKVEVVDTPGANGLLPMSEDEEVTRNILLDEDIKKVILVADSKNLERSLHMAIQLCEFRIPFVIALNMSDEARSAGIEIDPAVIKERLGVEAVPTVATRRQGITKLCQALARATVPDFHVKYDAPIEEAIQKIRQFLMGHCISSRALALMFLSGDRSLVKWAKKNLSPDQLKIIEETCQELEAHYGTPLGYVISSRRWELAKEITGSAMKLTGRIRADRAQRLGDIMMHRFWGWFVLAGVLYMTYEFVGRFGAGTLVDLLESGLFEKYINPAFVRAVEFLLPWSSLKIVRDALVGEYGMLTVAVTYAVAIILPIVSTFFIVFGILEDSGYLPRLAVMSNQLFKRIGLNGKAVLPMVLGLGCGTMAALTSRIMETRKERILVILLLALGVPCSAQLGVILGVLHDVGMLGGIIWFAVVVGVMMLVGYIAEKIIPGEEADFVLELPPVRVPQLSNIVIKTLARIEWYVKEAVPLFILGTFVLFVLDKSGVLKHIEAFASPVVQGWLNLPAKATEAFIVGFLRRDYGAAGLYALRENGMLDNIGVVVGMITITLFIPCIANFFMIIKELGLKAAVLVGAFIFPFAFLVGGLVNLILRGFHVGI